MIKKVSLTPQGVSAEMPRVEEHQPVSSDSKNVLESAPAFPSAKELGESFAKAINIAVSHEGDSDKQKNQT